MTQKVVLQVQITLGCLLEIVQFLVEIYFIRASHLTEISITLNNISYFKSIESAFVY